MEKPDFFGNWCTNSPQEGAFSALFEGYGDFQMKIEKREGKSIAGKIEDQYGSASFEGELTEQEIRFLKTYSPEAIARGGAPNGIRYHGRKYPDSYRGEYTVIQGISKGRVTDWNGQFHIIPAEAVRCN